MSVTLPKTSPYTAKDQLKADKCNKFIGQGSSKSSTNAYAKAYGNMANCGSYIKSDMVFISAEGNRTGRIKPNFEEIKLAADNEVTFITDTCFDRDRPYNIDEREIAKILSSLKYMELEPGKWVSIITSERRKELYSN